MFRRILIGALSAITLVSVIHAKQNPMPLCPSASAIQSVGVSMAAELMPGFYLGMEMNNYVMDQEWAFAIGPVPAHNEGEALAAANEKLRALSGPLYSEEDNEGVKICLYEVVNDPEIVAIAASGDTAPALKHTVMRAIKQHRK